MDYRDLENIGQQFGKRVRDAVDSFDFDHLNQEIRRTADDFIYGTGHSFNKNKTQHNNYSYTSQSDTSGTYNRSNWETYRKVGKKTTTYTKKTYGQQPQTWQYTNSDLARTQRGMEVYGFPMNPNPSGKVSGILLTVFGAIILGIFGLPTMFSFFMLFFDPEAFYVLGTVIPFTLIGFAMTYIGTAQRNRVKRYRRYLMALRGKSFESFKNLASRCGKSESFVRKDIMKMLSLNYFPQGHIDSHQTCLMVTDEIYDQYCLMMKNVEAEQKNEEKAEQKTKPKEPEVHQEETPNSEIRELEELGRYYRDKIRKANDDIPDVVISNKLYRMEELVEKIFSYVREYPEKADRLSQFQNYYMPMTMKLVETYRDLDGETVQGENIKKLKTEIEGTLDIINEAYENLYDSMYQETAMDVSSDISVLRTLLARDGLTKTDFKKKE